VNGSAADAVAVGDLDHGSGLGRRSLVARTFAWWHQVKRLRIRWQYRADIHEAFLKLTCCLSCWVVILLAALSTSGVGGRVGPHGQSKGS